MGSMKTLAYMETRRLARFLASQAIVVEAIEEVAEDFLSFHPDASPSVTQTQPAYIVIGAERGFCGDFNRALIEQLESIAENAVDRPPLVLALGHKLCQLLETHASLVAQVAGASVAEEVPAVIESLIRELGGLQKRFPGLSLTAIYHADEKIETKRLLPPFESAMHTHPSEPNPPALNVSPESFFLELVDHYLLAALNHVIYTSLMAENHRRVMHLDGAVRHLEEKEGELARKCNALRQEEITEEIEVILLSASSLDG